MPSGGNHGGAGRHKLPAELKAKTIAICISPLLIATLGDKKSQKIEAVLLRDLSISPLQWEIYTAWIKCDRQFDLTAKKLNRDPENIRQNVAKVERKLGIQEASIS